MKQLLLCSLLCLIAGPSSAASQQEVISFRDAKLPERCEANDAPKRYETRLGVLYQVACSPTAFGRLDVFILETGAGLELLRFPELRYQPQPDQFGQVDWQKVTFTGVGFAALLSGAQVNADAGVIRTITRVPPGIGTGQVEADYRLEESGPVLESLAQMPAAGDPRRAFRCRRSGKLSK